MRQKPHRFGHSGVRPFTIFRIVRLQLRCTSFLPYTIYNVMYLYTEPKILPGSKETSVRHCTILVFPRTATLRAPGTTPTTAYPGTVPDRPAQVSATEGGWAPVVDFDLALGHIPAPAPATVLCLALDLGPVHILAPATGFALVRNFAPGLVPVPVHGHCFPMRSSSSSLAWGIRHSCRTPGSPALHRSARRDRSSRSSVIAPA